MSLYRQALVKLDPDSPTSLAFRLLKPTPATISFPIVITFFFGNPMTQHIFEWREWMSLFRQSRVIIDHQDRTIRFIDAIRTKSFFNVLPIRDVSFHFSEVEEVRAYSESGHRCLLVETATAKGIFLDSDVPRFDEFSEQFLSIR